MRGAGDPAVADDPAGQFLIGMAAPVGNRMDGLPRSHEQHRCAARRRRHGLPV
jgi:hypothetical protein